MRSVSEYHDDNLALDIRQKFAKSKTTTFDISPSISLLFLGILYYRFNSVGRCTIQFRLAFPSITGATKIGGHQRYK